MAFTIPTKPRPILSELDKAYLAGLIDGEGSLTLNRVGARRGHPGVSAHVAIANTHKGVIDWVGQVTGSGCVVATYNHRKPRHRRIYRWDWASNDALWLLGELRPYLRIKAKQADALLFLDDVQIRYQTALGGRFGHTRPVPQSVLSLRDFTRDTLHALNWGKPLPIGGGAFTIPDESSAGHADQAEPKTLDFQALARRDTGIISGCLVTAQGTPNMTVAVSSGNVRVAGAAHAVTGANVTITANVSANPRYDAVVAASDGALSVIAGTAAAEATLDQPAVNLNTYAVLAIIYVAPGATAIGTPEIVQKQQTQNPTDHDAAHALNDTALHTGPLDDTQIPAGIARDSEVTTAVSNHTAASDPHGDRAAAATDASTKDATHAAAADPHTVYQKESERGVASGYASLDGNAQVPAAQLPNPTSSLLGGVKSKAAVTHEFLTSIGTDGLPVGAQPTLADISGLLDSSFALTGDITPTALSADAPNYNPTGLSGAAVIRQATNDGTTRTITGLAGGADGRIIFFENLGPGNIVLSDEDAASTAGNRFALTAPVTLAPDAMAVLKYDFTSLRWRAAGGGGANGTTPALVFDTVDAPGVSASFIRADDQIALFDNTAPKPIGAVATGGIMAPTVLDSGIDNTDLAAYTTGSIPTAAHYNELITFTVYSIGAADPNIPTLTTARGLSLVSVASRLDTVDHCRLTIFRTCIASGGSTGALTIDFGGQTQTLCAWEILSWRGTGATAANNGSDGIGVSASVFSGSNLTASPAVTLAALQPGSATYAGIAHSGNELTTPGAGWSELTDVHIGAPASALETQWKQIGAMSPSATWATASPSVVVACEIEMAAADIGVAARRGHSHATGATTPTTQAFGDAPAIGSGPAAAMDNHLHGMPAAPTHELTVTWSKQGAVAVTTDATAMRWFNDTGRTLTIASVRASVVTAPTGATLIVDVNKDGTTIFTTQASRPTIAISGNTNKVTNPDVTTIADGSYLTVNVDQIGSTIPGSDLTMQVLMRG